MKLKFLVFLCFPLLFFKRANAQEISPYKFSLGLKVLSYNEQMAIPNSDFNNNNYQLNNVTGLIFKVRSNLFSLRTGIEYLHQKDDNATPDCPTCPSNTGTYDTFKAGVGFEREFFYYKVRPVIGLDLFYIRSEYNGSTTQTGIASTSFENIRNGGGFSPFVGVKVYPHDRITIVATTNFNGIWFHEKVQTMPTGTNIRSSSPGTSRYETYFNPLGSLSLFYNFGDLEN